MCRRRLGVLASSALAGCAAPIPPAVPGDTAASARALLDTSAAAHGRAALAAIADISVSYAGEWRGFVDRLQPALVDAGYRGRSEERVLLGSDLVAQAHSGPAGRKQVVRRGGQESPGSVRVWYAITCSPTACNGRLAFTSDCYGRCRCRCTIGG